MSSEDRGSGHDGSGGLAAGGGGGEAESPAAGERKDLQSIKEKKGLTPEEAFEHLQNLKKKGGQGGAEAACDACHCMCC